MAGNVRRLLIVFALGMGLFAYLFHVPNGENVDQISRIRVISATMKMIKFLGQLSEMCGLSTEVKVQRQAAILFQRFQPKDENLNLEIEETMIEGIPVRIYRPLEVIHSKDDTHPALIYFHGGAYYLGSVDTHNCITATLARLTGFIVISVDYRLAPEHPFPAGVDDCTTVTKSLLNNDNARRLRIDSKRVAIGGDSAGGNFAAVVAMRLISMTPSVGVPHLVILVYPEVQFFDFQLPSFVEPSLQIFHFASLEDVLYYYFNNSFSPSIHHNRHVSVQKKKELRPWVNWSFIPTRYRQVYREAQTDDQDGDPQLVKISDPLLHRDASPLLVDDEDLSKLPPAYILTVEHDWLRDEAFIYATRLKATGVSVIHEHFDRAFHGSMAFLYGPLSLHIAHQMIQRVSQYLKDNL